VSDPARPAFLIVNADDFGYFPAVSRGIIEAHRQGVVTATGVLANTASFEQDIAILAAESGLDAGVHLNVTHGPPLTHRMNRRLRRECGEFAGKGWFARGYLAGKIRTDDVAEEWRAQIERCRDRGLTLRFLNSHEHVHMFPALFALIQSLATDYGIPFTRFPDTRIPWGGGAGDLVRCAALRGLAALNRRRLVTPAPRFLGAEYSGRLSQERLSAILTRLESGRVYELMCHPGYGDDARNAGSELRAYHGWEVELDCLTSDDTRMLCVDNNIRLVGYRDLEGLEMAP
jgi:predicted glycoside hydrolase/deacetylase ChbG (UPF0249 family)